ncbi:hypothetical protein DFH28DRAFT_1090470 [Melampsora americana]|nr:hypothetical protein DFH28DRAFT_1090470 [Melampsora americana]
MAPITPSSNKSSSKKSRSSASKKHKDQVTPTQDRRLSKGIKRPKLTSELSTTSLTPANSSQVSMLTAEDEVMATDPPSQTTATSPPAIKKSGLAPLTTMFCPPILPKPDKTESSSSEDEDEEDLEIETNNDHLKKEVQPELVTVNPLCEPQRPGLAPTANLPFDLQLWWNLYSECHTSESDSSLWAMVTVMQDTRKLSDYKIIKVTTSHLVNHVEPIIGAGSSKFFLIRFKSTRVKDNFRCNTRLDRGVYVSLSASARTSILVFNLEPISKLTPVMSSLFYQSLRAHSSNDRLSITNISEPHSTPTHTFSGARIFEVTFLRSVAFQWFDLLLKSNEYLPMTPWIKKGNEYKHCTILSQWRFIPSCAICGTSSYDASHRIKCTYLTIRDELIQSIESSYNSKSTPDLDDDQSSSIPVNATKKITKASKFTRQD